MKSIDKNFGTLLVRDTDLKKRLASRSCDAFCNITLPPSSDLGEFHIFNPLITLYRCNTTLKDGPSEPVLNHTGCKSANKNETIYFGIQNQDDPPPLLAACKRVQLPVNSFSFFPSDPFTFIAYDFPVQFQPSYDCLQCKIRGGLCRLNQAREFSCSKPNGTYV